MPYLLYGKQFPGYMEQSDSFGRDFTDRVQTIAMEMAQVKL